MQSLSYHPWFRVLLVLFLVLTAAAAAESPVQAAGTDEDGIIEEGETVYDDIILNAETVRVDGTVEGNVIASGYTIQVNGTITGDAFLFGSEVIIGEEGRIEGNLFSGAQTIRLSGEIVGSLAAGSSVLIMESGSVVAKNIYYGGFSFEMSEGSSVGVDIYSGNYQMLLNGTVGRDLNAGAAAVEINGTVNRNANLELDGMEGSPVYFPLPPGVSETLSPGLRVGDSAHIGGDLKYTTQTDQSSKIQSQPEGELIFQTPAPGDIRTEQEPAELERDNFFWVFGRFILRTLRTFWENFISLLAVGALIVLLLPDLFRRTVSHMQEQPLESAGFGLLTVILGYIALFLLAIVILAVSILLTFISAGGLSTVTFGFGFTSLALVGTIFTILLLYLSKIIAAYVVGHWILMKLAPSSKASESPFWGMALGVLIYSILRVIPVLGWLLAFVAIVMGMGAMWLTYQNRRRPLEGSALEVPAEAPAE